MADEVKQVKVDNWGIYFLQRLKHFFNRTDYCDLTLQFHDNAQLKVHRLVLSACTEYFELLERTCEMYEDCLVMPEDLQADIVVPIVNFMYTGQLEFKMNLLEKLYQCSEIMNMPVLTKLLDSHRPTLKATHSYTPVKKGFKRFEHVKEVVKSVSATEIVTTTPITYKRSHNKAFSEKTTIYRDKKVYLPINKPSVSNNGMNTYREPSPVPLDQRFNKMVVLADPRPTRYELPEELDTDNIFESSFCNISYTSEPLMVHPETRKQYAKRPKLAYEASTSKKFGTSTVDIVQCKKPIKEDSLFEDTATLSEPDLFSEQFLNNKPGPSKDTNQLFDQILDKTEDTKVVIETKNSKSSGNLDHAKIISEVLKKYPHLVKSNKNIKLKILNTPSKNVKKQKQSPVVIPKPIKTEKDLDFTYETDVLDSIQAARLIALGADNTDGPWICLICGTPGKAMNFTSYYKFRRHLIEVHNEKPVLNICEYCGQKSAKRNYLLHHLYTKHGVNPPPQYHFPKCQHCNYIALTEALLVKHKAQHTNEMKKFRCNVCPAAFNSTSLLLAHIQNTGHKYSAERKSNFQCIYCHQKVFLRETNLVAHLKTHHKSEAIQDGIIDDSDDDIQDHKKPIVKSEPVMNDYHELDVQYRIHQGPDGNINIVTKTGPEPSTSTKQTILNSGLSMQAPALLYKNITPKKPQTQNQSEYIQDVDMTTSSNTNEEIVVIDNTEYIMRDNQLIPRRSKQAADEYILSDDHNIQSIEPTVPLEFANMHNSNVQENIQHANMVLKNPENLADSIPIYVSNEAEYKALMANQPIIFDSNDANKTLTVLTAPHTSTLDTATIDLSTAPIQQANDMMIIQDNYPLNVSETVSTENSNIVVVYSHPVDGQNKQFQLITTQGLGPQFVQSSAIITQNFETITTTAPIMNTQGVEKQVQQVWQGNLNQIVNTDHIEITPVTVTQSIQEMPTQMQVLKPLESSNDMRDLPEIELSSNVSKTENNMEITATHQSQDTMVVEDVVVTNNLDKNTDIVENNLHTMTILEIEEVPTEHAAEETVDFNEDAGDPDQTIIGPENTDTNSAAVVDNAELIEPHPYTQPDHKESQPCIQANLNIEHVVETTDEINCTEQQQSDEVINNFQTTAEIEHIQENEEHFALAFDACEVSNNQDLLLANDAAGKSQDLNPDWSEENIQEAQEASTDETSQDDSRAQLNEQQDNPVVNMISNEMEESIENIQQEVDKQMAEAELTTEHDITDEVSDVANSSQDESDYVQKNSVAAPPVDPVIAQEKISSLLNDWEDNDSQEDNGSVNENAPAESEEAVENNVITETDNTDKQDKIKSLVSDWDEDDEENKE